MLEEPPRDIASLVLITALSEAQATTRPISRTHHRTNYRPVELFRRDLNSDVHAFVNCLKAQAAMSKNILGGGGYRRFGIRY